MAYYYTYITVLENHQLYVGKRKSKVNPLLDNYFGTIKKKCENWKPINKYFLKFTTEPLINTFNECAFHSWLDVGKNPRFYNKAKQTSVGFDRTGIKLTLEQRTQLALSSTGNFHTEEIKNRMSEIRREFYESKKQRKLQSERLKAYCKANPEKKKEAGKKISEAKRDQIIYLWSNKKIGLCEYSSKRDLSIKYHIQREFLNEVTNPNRNAKSAKNWVCCGCQLRGGSFT